MHAHGSDRSDVDPAGSQREDKDRATLSIPQISLPKGGGAIRGIGEKFAANPVTGTGSMSVPIFTSPGRSGFGPQLSLSYDSGYGNGVFGLGWNLALPSITRKTDKGLPRYEDLTDSDVFMLSGAEDLVPVYKKNADGTWARDAKSNLIYDESTHGDFSVRRYRPRIEGLFALIERWTNRSGETFWRSISKDNITTYYGKTGDSRISDPGDGTRDFSWLISESWDDKGNAIAYEYKREDDAGLEQAQANDRNRIIGANLYPKHIFYGNRISRLVAPDLTDAEWLFEIVFDYGEHSGDDPKPDDAGDWLYRHDPFSKYRATFELRTRRLCQRVLMFHHFPDQDVGDNCLVKSTNFVYRNTRDLVDDLSKGNPIASFLAQVTQSAYKRKAEGGYLTKSLPPLTFEYSSAAIQSEIRDVDTVSLENLPSGLSGTGYQWFDLEGEGVSGVLFEQPNAWWYKRNLSPISVVEIDGESRNIASFAAAELIRDKPAYATTVSEGWQFHDLAGRGRPNLVRFDGPLAGFFEWNEEDLWSNFVPLSSSPNVNWLDPNLRFVDLTGDGLSDVLITEDQAFTWYRSLGDCGFAASERTLEALDEERGPRLLFADREQAIYLADFSGDGLTDLVRIRNGEVCYWPNQGYGDWGSKVTMDNAPWFDAPDQFAQNRIRLADVDGSGVVDLVYLGRRTITVYFNQSGNSWSVGQTIDQMPLVDDLASVQAVDLLGNGTACLVWSSPLPGDARRSMRYIDLMGGQKPHLLVKAANNLGTETNIEYAPSTRFYLQDRAAGMPWVTKLPFPVHVVAKVKVTDQWRKISFSSSYSYHHGYFDGVEREFRGFGRIEKIDTENYGTVAQDNLASPYITDDLTLYQPPVKTITWVHTGAALKNTRILTQFASEYFPYSMGAMPTRANIDDAFEEKPLSDPDLSAENLSDDEWVEALRACKGMTLRQEVYELDVNALASSGLQIPVRLFSAAHHNCNIRRLQPKDRNQHAIFLVTESESVAYHYELDLRPASFPEDPLHIPDLKPDPRVAHTLNVSFDEYGNVQQAITVGYKRLRAFNDAGLSATQLSLIQSLQDELHVAYTETHYTGDVIGPAAGVDPIQYYRLRAPCEVQIYELTGVTPGAIGYFDLPVLRTWDMSTQYLSANPTKPFVRKQYHQLPTDSSATMRLVEHSRTLFFSDDSSAGAQFLTEPLPLGVLGKLGLVFENYRLALTDSLLKAVFTGTQRNQALSDGSTVLATLKNWKVSGYMSETEATTKFGASATGEYWMRSGIAGFSPEAWQHFYLPERYTDPFNNTTILQYYQKYDLFISSSTDALGNQTKIVDDLDPARGPRFDYRVLAPVEMEDLNGNRTEAWFDVFGMVVAVAVKGKGAEADNLSDYDDDLANPDLPVILSHFDLPPLAVNEARDRFSPMLGNATTRFLYHFGEQIVNGTTEWMSRPAGACTIVREQHVGAVKARQTTGADATSPLQVSFECSDGMGAVLMKRIQAEPETADGPLRWIVNGKTVLNNKAMPVKQYESYFSSAASCRGEGDIHEEVGVTSIMYYDATGRLMRTEMPDATLSRIEFSPWHIRRFDQNDTVLESQWYHDRGAPKATDPEPNDPDQRAAWLAVHHAHTPSHTILDSLGRAVVSIVHNRVDDGAGGLRDERYLTFTKLDAESKPLWIRDDRQNLVMQYITPVKPTIAADEPDQSKLESIPAGSVPCYDIAGNLLFQHSMDAGDRSMINDAAGKPMFAWDDRDNFFVSSYDQLHRPTRLELSNPVHSNFIVAGLTQYGENTAGSEGNNLRGKTYRSFDQGGMVTNQQFDFKGNALLVSRRFASDYQPDTDWHSVLTLPLAQDPASILMPESFNQITSYDALNRITLQYNWAQQGKPVAVYGPTYNARGLLQSEALTVGATKQSQGFTGGVKTTAILSVTYDAKGQRLSVTIGNGVVTAYTYDPKTFRLATLVSTRPGTGNQRSLQNLRHTYDPSGNITEIFDDAVPTEYFNNAVIKPRKLYVYDALYRLLEAGGREHAGQLAQDPMDNWNDCPFRIDYGVNNSKAWRNYRQRYTYDSVGNILIMQHITPTETAQSWTRQYQYATDSNRLLATGMGSAAADHYPAGGATLKYSYSYNAHGSMEAFTHLPTMDWNYTEHLAHISRAPASRGNDPDGCTDSSLEAWYRYDARKQRTRKRVAKQGGLVEERLYLGGLEWYRRSRNGGVVEEIETLHLFDGHQRLLMVDQVIRTDRAELGVGTLYRYTLSNHLGSSTVEVDENAGIISFEEYHPYGTTAYQSGPKAAEVKLKRYRYTRMERDEESGLSYHGARYYAPWFGRWASCDPAGLGGGLNAYSYGALSPLSHTDTNGRAAAGVTLGSGLYGNKDFFGVAGYIKEHALPGKQVFWINAQEFGLDVARDLHGRTYANMEARLTRADISDVKTLLSHDPVTGLAGDNARTAILRKDFEKGMKTDLTKLYLENKRNYENAVREKGELTPEVKGDIESTLKSDFGTAIQSEKLGREAKAGKPLSRVLADRLNPEPAPVAVKPQAAEVISYKKPPTAPAPSPLLGPIEHTATVAKEVPPAMEQATSDVSIASKLSGGLGPIGTAVGTAATGGLLIVGAGGTIIEAANAAEQHKTLETVGLATSAAGQLTGLIVWASGLIAGDAVATAVGLTIASIFSAPLLLIAALGSGSAY
jgi:RHS repeat-associated protein